MTQRKKKRFANQHAAGTYLETFFSDKTRPCLAYPLTNHRSRFLA